VTQSEIKRAIVQVVRESGPIGWYGIERRLRVPRNEFKEGYTLMTYLEELVSAGVITRVDVSGQERFVLAAQP
jgi:hypothetical protein